MATRIEKDSLGAIEVPADAWYGAQTARARENFPISGRGFPRRFLEALGLIKLACAEDNGARGLLSAEQAEAIAAAAREVVEGTLDAEFVVDIFQTGSGTSTNMNANEVIANRAAVLLGGSIGDHERVHPNDHVNLGQSSNDVIPSALHVAAFRALEEDLLPSLEQLATSLESKAHEFAGIVKTGRTHLMDAAPITLGQEFSGYAAQMRGAIARVEACEPEIAELALGGTAVGTGLNAQPGQPAAIIARLAAHTELPFVEAPNHFEAQGARDAAVSLSGALRTTAVSLMKIANDLRWLGSGPRAGLSELKLPALQPGSSIMPGKVNPVIPESCRQVAAQVMGNDQAVAIAGSMGDFELNVMIPVIARNLLESIDLLAKATRVLAESCIDGIEADEETCRRQAERNLQVGAALNPRIGYDRASEIVKQAAASDRSVKEVARDAGVLDPDELDEILDPKKLV